MKVESSDLGDFLFQPDSIHKIIINDLYSHLTLPFAKDNIASIIIQSIKTHALLQPNRIFQIPGSPVNRIHHNSTVY